MPHIHVLPAHEAQKIAAGEVVERPASVVKELVENALDAGSTKVSVQIEGGGATLMRVVDNGHGMDKEDAQRCFEKHATSKIRSIADLDTINTFGFRGEALASVAAIARVTMLTKQENALEGWAVEVARSNVTSIEPTACPTGTDISVRDIFYEIPARKKFLKSPETEWRHVLNLMQAFCFDYPDKHFTLHSEGKLVLNCPPVASLEQRCAQIWEYGVATHTIAVHAQRDVPRITIEGIISNHQRYRYDRSSLFFFVNKRWVKNQKLTSALLKGYGNVLPQGKFPLSCIKITIDPLEVDINAHPRKEEVRFMHPRIVEQLLEATVRQALESRVSQNLIPPHTPSMVSTAAHQQPLFTARQAAPKPWNTSGFTATFSEKPVATQSASIIPSYDSAPHDVMARESTYATTTLQKEPFVDEQQKLDTDIPAHHIIGQFSKTYILIEKNDGLLLIDQHAAHERILYETFEQRFHDVPTIPLLFPQIVTVSTHDMPLILAHLDVFARNGITLEQFGDDQLVVQAIPIHLKNAHIADFIREVIGWMHEYEHVDAALFFKQVTEKLRAQMACKAAVKAGDELTPAQMEELVRDLAQTKNRLTCPHGRPTSWLLTTYDIEKTFKRIV
jgi:DNA mismatch repair protein MutL